MNNARVRYMMRLVDLNFGGDSKNIFIGKSVKRSWLLVGVDVPAFS